MTGDEKILGLIVARGGSKGVPRKNIREVGGMPLIGWTIQAAKKSRRLDRVVLSTDSEEIAEIARGMGCEVPFLRSAELAMDDTSAIGVVLDAIERVPGYDRIVLLQATSPLRQAQDIDAGIELCEREKSSSCVSVTLTSKSPEWMYRLDAKNHLRPIVEGPPLLRRQDADKAYVLNGALYVAAIPDLIASKSFLNANTVAYVMPTHRSIDVDTEMDLRIVQLYFEDPGAFES